MSQIRISPQAALDLDEIWNFIGIERRSPDAAYRQVEMIYDKFCILAESPLLGERRKDLGAALRVFSAGNYVIVYRPTDDGIAVARVVHGARDIGRLFNPK
jgi:toxin ParE1/3/4